MTRGPWLGLLGVVLVGGCLGGQTGDDTGNGGPAAPVCEKSEVEVSLDQELPAGYTARDLIEVFDGASVPAYVLPAHTTAADHELEPDDALAMTQVMLAFEPADEDGVALFEGADCTFSGFTVYGTMTATALDGEIVLSGRGGIAGAPHNAYFWSGDTPSSAGRPNPELYGDYVLCSSDLHPITLWMSGGQLMGNLCTSQGLVRFPTACGGYAQVPLDEPVEGGLPLPSAALERVQDAELEVAWTGTDRSALVLTITPAELACYEEVGYDDEREQPYVTSTTPVDVAMAIDDVGIELAAATELAASYGYSGDSDEAVSRLRACTDLRSAEVDAVNERLDSRFRHIHACLSVIVRADERLEVALELSGASKDAAPGAQPGDSVEVEELSERVLVLEVAP